jgi:hypothetical protein
MRMAFFQHGDPELEAWGIRLAGIVAARLSQAFGPLPPDPHDHPPIGPDFQYGDGPNLFLGRRGRGPLHVVLDTNLLLDYFQHGRAMWEQDVALNAVGEYGAELEALQLAIALWVLRDIRFYILPQVLADAKTKLTEERLAHRWRALTEFSKALSIVAAGEGEHDPIAHHGPLILPDRELQRVLRCVPEGGDRMLVQAAVRRRAHIFLTRDKKVLACKDSLKPFGLLLASPGDLLEELVACGAFNCLLAPERYLYWPMPDQGRVTYLVRILTEDVQLPTGTFSPVRHAYIDVAERMTWVPFDLQRSDRLHFLSHDEFTAPGNV